MKKVLVVDDQRMSRENMEHTIAEMGGEYTLSKSVFSAELAYFVCMQKHIDLVLMDVCTSGSMDGIDAAERIKREFPNIKIVVVTSMVEESYIRRAKAAKVDSFWYKDISKENLSEVIRRTMNGESIFPDKTPDVQIGLARSCDLTEMEINVLRLVCEGYEYAEMAEKLHISQRTIKYHMGNLLSKTGYSNKIQLAIAATKNSYIVPRLPDEPK